VLRTIPGLTTGDGWTPADIGLKLARLVNDNLPRKPQLVEEQFENGTQWGHWNKEKQAEYWTKHHGWTEWQQQSAKRSSLPTPDDGYSGGTSRKGKDPPRARAPRGGFNPSHHRRSAGKCEVSEVARQPVQRARQLKHAVEEASSPRR
jgi:hypothetical protein